MSSDSSFSDLLRRFSEGDQQQAAELIYQRFASRLTALAARRLSERFRARVGPEDVVQSVFATFFRRNGEGEFHLRDWDSLWGLLACITIKRIHRHHERNAAACRDVRREAPPPEDSSWLEVQSLDREPLAEEVLMVQELTEKMLEGMPARNQSILEMVIAGHTYEQIARSLNTSISTVDRVVRRGRERLAKCQKDC